MAGEGLATARVMLAFPGTVIVKWATWGAGWSQRVDALAGCTTCGGSTVQYNPDGEPDHFRHYQDDGEAVIA